ncbi:MAG TPA: YifB family Mg chelatase-like AAA ATPase [Steroidobacteraceae bacterium]|nr:YifB family Mg chelatase-like AAA ATPase [Steroidobacteraceae bacterium]
MAVARVACRAQLGLQAPLVHVEVSLASGLPAFCIVGLPATVVKESKERVRAALLNSRFEFPAGRITVNLAPADLPKEGGRFDLPIALGILIASGQIRSGRASGREGCETREFYGELGLTGELKPVRGLLLAAAQAQQHGHELIVPRANAAEAGAAAPARVRAASHLLEVCAHVSGETPLPTWTPPREGAGGRSPDTIRAPPDLADVRGQAFPKRALVIAAAGGHSLLMIGPPGSGKSMLAQRLPGLLPPLDRSEALEVAAIAAVSAAGFTADCLARRPFRAPHHTASAAALVGGGARARPGEISLAHHGVLFLDELPEFDRAVLEALREPLDTGTVAVSRAALQSQYPAEFQLIAAMNPCPCGRQGDPAGDCRCTPAQIRRYLGRVSGPLLDRLDMHVEVPRVTAAEFEAAERGGESSRAAADRIAAVRGAQLGRQGRCNARLSDAEVQRWCVVDEAGARVLEKGMRQRALSGRARVRLLRLARTIADLQGAPAIGVAHIGEALMLRCLDRAATPPSAPCDRRPA